MEYVQIQAPLEAKHRKFMQEDKRPQRKTDAAGAGGMHGHASQSARPCIRHHGPWWLLPGLVPTLLERCVLVQFWSAGFCLGSSVLDLLGFFY